MTVGEYALHQSREGELDVVVATMRGRASYDVIDRVMRELDAIAQRGPCHMLVDQTEVTLARLSTGDIVQLAQAWQKSVGLLSARIAILAPDLLIYGLNRMAHSFAGDLDGKHLAVFRERDDALAWLSLEGQTASL